MLTWRPFSSSFRRTPSRRPRRPPACPGRSRRVRRASPGSIRRHRTCDSVTVAVAIGVGGGHRQHHGGVEAAVERAEVGEDVVGALQDGSTFASMFAAICETNSAVEDSWSCRASLSFHRFGHLRVASPMTLMPRCSAAFGLLGGVVHGPRDASGSPSRVLARASSSRAARASATRVVKRCPSPRYRARGLLAPSRPRRWRARTGGDADVALFV